MAERKINNNTYRVEPLPAGEAIELFADIMLIVGPAAGRLPAIIIAMSETGEGGTVMTDVAAIAAMSDIVKASSPAAVRKLVDRIASVAKVQSSSGEFDKVSLDEDFERPFDAIPVLRFVIEEQFSDFFTASAGSGIFGRLLALSQRKK